MKGTAESPIPRITADVIITSAMLAKLQAPGALRLRCHVVQGVAMTGRPLDELTVGELLQVIREAGHAAQ